MLNPYFCSHEGARRLSIVLLVIGVLSWWFYVLTGIPSQELAGRSLLIFLGPPILAYLVTLILKLLADWVWRGFLLREPDNK